MQKNARKKELMKLVSGELSYWDTSAIDVLQRAVERRALGLSKNQAPRPIGYTSPRIKIGYCIHECKQLGMVNNDCVIDCKCKCVEGMPVYEVNGKAAWQTADVEVVDYVDDEIEVRSRV